jgi:outer membrane protein TolC
VIARQRARFFGLRVTFSFLMTAILCAPDFSFGQEENRIERASRDGVRRIKAELKRIERARSKRVAGETALKLPKIPSQSPVLKRRRKVLAISLNDAVRLALRNDLSSQIALENAKGTETSVESAKGAFDPAFEASFFRSRGRRTNIFQNPLTGLPANAVTNQTDRLNLALSASKLFSYGGRGSLSWTQSRSETLGATNNPQVDVNVSVSFTQPLLKGRGFEVTLANLRNSGLDRTDAYARFGQSLQQLILDVRQAYWAVVSAEENLTVQKTNLLSALDFLENERTRLSLGARKSIDVALAEVTVARRMEAVIRAETQIENSRDSLLNRISPSADLLAWDVFLVPLDRPVYISPPDFELTQALATAWMHRLDLQIAARDVKRQKRKLVVAKNNVLPALDLSLSGGVATTQRKHHNAYEALDPPEESFNIRAGLTFKFPLYFRTERAQAAQARYSLRASELSLEKRRSDAILEIRRAIRSIISARERVVVNQQLVQTSAKQLNQERESNKDGLSTARNLLDAQQRLADAQLSLQQSLIDYRESIVAFHGSTGVLLNFYRKDFSPQIQAALEKALPAQQ